MNIFEALEALGLVYHHSAWERGYISRKLACKVEEYEGRFGKGYKVHIPSYQSTIFHRVMYYIMPDDQ